MIKTSSIKRTKYKKKKFSIKKTQKLHIFPRNSTRYGEKIGENFNYTIFTVKVCLKKFKNYRFFTAMYLLL